MKIARIVLFKILSLNSVFSQIEDNMHKLNSIENLLTDEVENIIDTNLVDKKVVFLGESDHHIASDFLAKTEFVKYLVLEKGYKDIAFESDFFGLYFDHNKRNIFGMWSNSIQCRELFTFLDKHRVTIWGFDNQFEGYYSFYYYSSKIKEFLEKNDIEYSEKFIDLLDIVSKYRFQLQNQTSKKEIEYLINTLNELLSNKKILTNQAWYQILESSKSSIQMYTTNKRNGIILRDTQMAKNLNFLVNTMPERKFIVWLANAHMAKYELEFMKGQTMGSQFISMNPDISYHIAFSSIYMPYRKDKWIEKSSKDQDNLLHFLPSTQNNYFINSNNLIKENPKYADKEYEGMFNLQKDKTNWFKLFDALVFISNGEKIKYQEGNN